MIVTCFVIYESLERWPARKGRPAGESFTLLLQDRTSPRHHALDGIFEYHLTPDERDHYWGQCLERSLVIAVNKIIPSKTHPGFRGAILQIDGKPVA